MSANEMRSGLNRELFRRRAPAISCCVKLSFWLRVRSEDGSSISAELYSWLCTSPATVGGPHYCFYCFVCPGTLSCVSAVTFSVQFLSKTLPTMDFYSVQGLLAVIQHQEGGLWMGSKTDSLHRPPPPMTSVHHHQRCMRQLLSNYSSAFSGKRNSMEYVKSVVGSLRRHAGCSVLKSAAGWSFIALVSKLSPRLPDVCRVANGVFCCFANEHCTRVSSSNLLFGISAP